MVRRLHHKTFFSKENTMAQQEMLRAGWKAWQWHKIKEKWRGARGGRLEELPRALIHAAAGLPVHLLRYLRGYPTSSGV